VPQTSPPFTLSGSPLPAQIKGVFGLVEKVRKAGATKDTSVWNTYFALDNYDNKTLSTENIIDNYTNSTLRFKEETYTLLFIAVHNKIWATPGSSQLTLLFRAAESKNFFHICIPIVQTDDNTNESPFLRSWFVGSPINPSGLTLNDVLNFRGYEKAVDFSLMEFCLQYNRGGNADYMKHINVYNFCLFDTPLNISKDSYARCKWLSTSDKETFDQIFNLYLRSEIYLFVSDDIRDPYLISNEEHFGSDDRVTQNATIPAFFTVETKALSGGMYTPDQLKPTVRGLQNVKCYPIDLATQIDDNGNIYIDRTTNKPTDTNDVLKELRAPSGTGQLNAQNSYDYGVAKREKNKAILLLFKILLGLVILIIIVYIAMSIISPSGNKGFFGRGPSSESIRVGTNAAADAIAAAATAGTLTGLTTTGPTRTHTRHTPSTPGSSASGSSASGPANGSSSMPGSQGGISPNNKKRAAALAAGAATLAAVAGMPPVNVGEGIRSIP
jgi:uncharacterized protein (UPF0333 family)